MKKLIVGLLLPLLLGCTSAGHLRKLADTSGVVPVFGYDTGAHICPISEDTALTARHVVVPDSPLEKIKDLTWEGGVVKPSKVSSLQDIAVVTTDGLHPFSKYYPLAEAMPTVGDVVCLVNFNFDDVDHAYAEAPYCTTISNMVAQHIILKQGGTPGSSGGCVINTKGELVGINVWYREMDKDSKKAGVVVGAWVNSSLDYWLHTHQE